MLLWPRLGAKGCRNEGGLRGMTNNPEPDEKEEGGDPKEPVEWTAGLL